MKVSIIVPVYNVAEYIEKCVKSVMAQDYEGMIECFLIDDCGSDDSIDICERLIGGYDGKIVFKILRHEKNGGLSAARNTGIRAATGDYLYFLDSDDALYPYTIRLLVEKTEEYGDVDIVQGVMIRSTPGEDGLLSGISYLWIPEYRHERKDVKKTIINMPPQAWNKLIRREFITGNGLFYVDGLIHEDEMWRTMAAKYVKSIAYCHAITYWHRTDNPISIMHTKVSLKRVDSYIKIMEYKVSNLDSEVKDVDAKHMIILTQKWQESANRFLDRKDSGIKQRLGEFRRFAKACERPALVKYLLLYWTLPYALTSNRILRYLHKRTSAKLAERYINGK